jgi:hypothetical protein
VECRAEDDLSRDLLRALHDATTAAEVAAEFAAADELGAEHRAAFGGTAVSVPELGKLLFARGPASNDEALQWPAPPRPLGARPWDGGSWHRACTHRSLAVDPPDNPAVFVAHWRALNAVAARGDSQRIWVSGWQSWQRLSAAGLWVEGCADGLGFDALRPTLATEVLQLPPLDDWLVLTRDGAEDSWQGSGVARVVGSYALEPPDTNQLRELRSAASQATHFFWSSREQYLALRDCLPPTAHHACGTGKTFRALSALGVPARAFPNREAWQTWLN